MSDKYTCTDAISKLGRVVDDGAESKKTSVDQYNIVVGAHADLVYIDGDTVRHY